MARSHVRWQFGAWRDPEHADTSKDARLLYMTILADETLNQAGVVVMRPAVWGEDAAMSDDEVDVALEELERRRFVVVDRRWCQLLVRTFIRNDGVADEPNVLRSALSAVKQVRSDRIRRALAIELRKLPPQPPDKQLRSGRLFVYPDPHGVADAVDPGEPSHPSRNPSANPPRKGSGNPSEEGSAEEPFPEGFPEPSVVGVGEVEGVRTPGSSSVGGQVSSKIAVAISDAPPVPEPPKPARRDDVEQLCVRLAEHMVANGAKAPTIGDPWRRAARLLLDRDEQPLDQALRLLDWCQRDSFWHRNIHSMPTFREKYDRLLMDAREEQRQRQGQRSGRNRSLSSEERAAQVQALKTSEGQAPSALPSAWREAQ